MSGAISPLISHTLMAWTEAHLLAVDTVQEPYVQPPAA